MFVSGYMPKKIRVGRSENQFIFFLLLLFFFRISDRCHDHHAWSRHRESWFFYWLMKSLTSLLVLNWSFWAFVSLLIVQTLAKFLQKHTSLWRFPPAFPLTNSDTIKSARVGGKKLGSVGKPETKVFFYLALQRHRIVESFFKTWIA